MDSLAADVSCLHERVGGLARRTPDSVALTSGSLQVTYGALAGRASAIAARLRAQGVGPDARVGMAVSRSPDGIAAILGILWAGGAWVPLDPSYPRARLGSMARDARLTAVVTTRRDVSALPALDTPLLTLDDIPYGAPGTHAWACEPAASTPDQAAYVIYTSGSTGAPKGVVIPHRGLSHLARIATASFDPRPGDRVFQFASYNFDASVFELTLALASGATLVTPPAGVPLVGATLLAYLQSQGITHTLLPPSVLATLPVGALPALRVLISGGEPCTPALVHRFAPGRRFFNAYGPTEVTVYATLWEARGDGPPTLGTPVADTTVTLLDPDGQPVPAGEAGEIAVGGPGLAQGYLDREALTAARFIPDPTGRHARVYRTGDLGLWQPDGTLGFLGRSDRQVKVRGFRVEPGEIEAALTACPGVQHAVVGLDPVATDTPRLVAWVVIRPEATEDTLTASLRARLAEVLPGHMVPAVFVPVAALPMTPNGKVDHAALPVPPGVRPDLSAPYVAPGNATEAAVARVWADRLGLDRVGIHDDFLALGGDSLMAVRIAARLQDVLGVRVNPDGMLTARTVATLAGTLDPAQPVSAAGTLAPLTQRPHDRRPAPASWGQARLWLVQQADPTDVAYTLAAVVTLDGPVDPARVHDAMTALVARHEALRTTLAMDAGVLVQQVAPPGRVDLRRHDLRGLTDAARATLADGVFQAPFDLAHGPVWRAALCQREPSSWELWLAMHHAVSDGWSMGVLLRDLVALYDGRALDPVPVQPSDHAVWERSAHDPARVEAGLARRVRALQGAPTVLPLPGDGSRQGATTSRAARVDFSLDGELTAGLRTVARHAGATLFMALLGGFAAVLRGWTGAPDVLLATPVAHRTHTALEPMVGFLAETLVLRARVADGMAFRDLLGAIREETLGALADQDVPFDRVVRALQPDRAPGGLPLTRVMFAMQAPPFRGATQDGVTVAYTEAHPGASPYDLLWQLWETPTGLNGSVLYRTDAVDEATVTDLVARYRDVVQAAVRDPDAAVTPAVTETLDAAGAWDDRVSFSVGDGTPDARRVTWAVPGPATWGTNVAVDGTAEGYVAALPRDADGAVDTAALAGLARPDAAAAQGLAAWLRAQPGVTHATVSVGWLPDPMDLPPPVHVGAYDAEPMDAPTGAPTGAPTDASMEPLGTAEAVTRAAYADGGPLALPAEGPATLTEALFQAARSPRGTTYVEADGTESVQPYRDLLAEATGVLAGLRAAGLRAGDRVVLHMDVLRAHFTTFWACVLGGMVPVTVAVAPSYESPNNVLGKLLGVWQLLGRPRVVVRQRLVPALEKLATWHEEARGMHPLAVESLIGHSAVTDTHPSHPGDVAFLQLSSGSTGVPKCIQVTHGGVIRHVHGARLFNGYSPEDIGLNWLPTDHVVPVLTCHLKDVVMTSSGVHVATACVLADPLSWLDLLVRFRVTHTWSPNFGYNLVATRLPAVDGRTWDLSRVRAFMNAGEQVTLPVVQLFLARTAGYGVAPGAMQPSFGMAEACTCMTFCNGFDPAVHVHHVQKRSLGGALRFAREASPWTVAFVDLGPPVAGVEIRIADADGRTVPEGTVGRLQIRGGVVTPGYLLNPAANAAGFPGDGWFDSGDLGFLHGGRLALTGRGKETLIIRGANHDCYDIEAAVQSVPGVLPSWVAACAVEDPAHGTEGLAVFFVPREATADIAARADLVAAVRGEVTRRAGIAPTWVTPVQQEVFPRTTSGKIQRNALRKALADGVFREELRALDLHSRNTRTLPGWFHRVTWRPAVLSGETLPPPRACLVITDPRGLGATLADRLRALGTACTELPAEACTEPAVTARIAALPRDLTVVHTGQWGPLTDHELTGPHAFLRALVQRGEGRVKVLVVARHSQPVTATDTVEPVRALAQGLLRSVPHEAPWMDTRHVDVDGWSVSQDVDCVLREVLAAQRDREVAWRDGRRYVPRLERLSPETIQPGTDPLRHRGAYLLAGGLGGVGTAVARALVQRHRAHVLLVGRTDTDTAVQSAAWQTLAETARSAGGTVHYARADVADVDAVRAAVTAWERPLDGVFHLAGVMGECTLAEQSMAQCLATVRAQMQGSTALAAVLGDNPQALWVGTSSVNAWFGGFGVGAYSAASRYASRFAHARRTAGFPRSVCIAWSRWEDTGMSRGTGLAVPARLRGFVPVTPDTGVRSLRVALRMGEPDVVVGLDDRNHHVMPWRADGPHPVRGLVAQVTGTVPVDVPPVRDPWGRTVAVAVSRTETVAQDTSPALQGAGPAAGAETTVADIWQSLLEVPRVGRNDNFFDLGGHSMLLVQVASRLQKAFGREVPVVELFRRPTVAALASWLDSAHAGPAAPAGDAVADRARKQREAMAARRPGSPPRGR